MSSTAKKIREISLQLFIFTFVIFILLLTSINIENFLTFKRVLGIQTTFVSQNNKKQIFWENFLSNNPNYIPGWIETGNADKAKEIDPNFNAFPLP